MRPAWAGDHRHRRPGPQLAGKGSLDGATQTLPALYALPSTAFIIVGTSGGRGRVSAAATANTSTGRGTPWAAVIAGLVAELRSAAHDKHSRRALSQTKRQRTGTQVDGLDNS